MTINLRGGQQKADCVERKEQFDPVDELSMSSSSSGRKPLKQLCNRDDDIEWPPVFFFVISLVFSPVNIPFDFPTTMSIEISMYILNHVKAFPLHQYFNHWHLIWYYRRRRIKWLLCSKASKRRLTSWASAVKRPKWPSSASIKSWLTSTVSHLYTLIALFGGGVSSVVTRKDGLYSNCSRSSSSSSEMMKAGCDVHIDLARERCLWLAQYGMIF